jgi:hypothetical protein
MRSPAYLHINLGVDEADIMTPEFKALSDLIGEIYDTTVDRKLWPVALSRAAGFVGGSAASIFSKSPTSGTVHFAVGIDPYYRQLYFEKYVKLDPSSSGQYFAEIGHPMSTADFMPYHEFLETRFYKEWARQWRRSITPILLMQGTTAS